MHRAASSRPSPVTVVVADDHPLIIAGMASLPARWGVRVVACCTDGRAALEAIVAHRPDVAVLDDRMPHLSGREVLGEVMRLKLATRVIVCSAHVSPGIVHTLLAGGARGFVAKTAPASELCLAVRRVAAGGTWLAAELREGVLAQVAGGGRPPSPRELEAVRLLAEGLTHREIGLRMNISHETVRTNLRRAQAKLGVCDSHALVREAMRRGLIE